MRVVLLIVVLVWVVASTLWDNRKANKQRMLLQMKRSYSRREALDLVFSTKRSVMVLFLAYGFLIGVLIVGLYGR